MNRLWSRLRLAAFLTTVIAASAYFMFSVKYHALTLPTQHLDGAFQTASGLFRLSAGQLPGRDFFPYLGIGPLFLLYPIFVIEGGDLAASVIAAQVLTLITTALCVSVVAFFWIPRNTSRRGVKAVALGFAIVAAMLAMRDVLPYWAADQLQPGNSLRPLRSAWPYMASTAFHVAATRKSRSAPYMILGLLGGITTMWSNDFAAPTIFACLVGAVGIAYSRQEGYLLSAVLFAGAFLVAASLFVVATAGEFAAMLRYNFIDVATDQWWYFGPWAEETRIFSPVDVHRVFEPVTWFGLLVLAGLAWRCYRRPSVELFALLLLGCTLFVGGALATIGGHRGGYFVPFLFWSVVTTVCAAATLLLKLAGVRMFVAVVWVMPVMTLALAFGALRTFDGAARYLPSDPQWFYVSELGGYLREEWKVYVDAARAMPRGREIEEYWGLWSAIRRPASLLPVDSVIHALGATRERAMGVMNSLPDTVITTRPSFSEWQNWSFSANYWLYQPLLQHYKIDATSPHTIIWKRAGDTSPWSDTPCVVSGDTIQLGMVPRGFYEVTLSYSLPNTGRWLAVLKNGIVQVERHRDATYVALPNTATTFITPVFASGVTSARFEVALLPLRANRRVTLKACSAKAMPPDALATFVYPDAALPITDDAWLRGVNRSEPQFAVAMSQPNIEAFKEGRTVVLANGERRIIIGTTADVYKLQLFVKLDGAVMNADLVGYPHRIAFADEQGAF
ncbi:hypothetical protein ACQ858_18755 [Variovorax ureilyticus]|uniref:hypothetical protein n=1 Tax=Variovorax ureilyticus TaxID=1836198 RepID=UPI003D679FA5